MIIKTGNMFGEYFDIEETCLIATANSTLKKDGSLVMGRGAALLMKTLYAGIDKRFGELIKSSSNPNLYGLIIQLLDINARHRLGIFQVKKHFKDDADINIIKCSTEMLSEVARSNVGLTYRLNFPGIGAGNLSHKSKEIYDIIKDLPDNVEVWTYEAQEIGI